MSAAEVSPYGMTANQSASVGDRDAFDIITNSEISSKLIDGLVASFNGSTTATTQIGSEETVEAFTVALAALQVFLQINVTGPVASPRSIKAAEQKFLTSWNTASKSSGAVEMRRACLEYLQIDGTAPYAYIPYIELFCLAKHIITVSLASETTDLVMLPTGKDGKTQNHSIAWAKLRVHAWHYKLIAQPTFGGANFTKSSQWSELPTLARLITELMDSVKSNLLGEDVWAGDGTWSTDDKVEFLLESANNYVLLGRADLAKTAIKEATQVSGLTFALSGALGKRTKFQEKSVSQMVVLAKSNSANDEDEDTAKPQALPLNNDTLLEEIKFTREENGKEEASSELPQVLADLIPDNQPQLNPLDQIILLAEATLKDAFSPVDTLTSEEIMPFASRVISDKSTNWQIYTQALLVRSRIEIHRSRTMERGILQLQALADQVISDTTYAATEKEAAEESQEDNGIPTIAISAPGQDKTAAAPPSSIPTTFLPAPTEADSAPADARLRYVHALSTPPRWHLESELAFAWASVGSLVSAQEIFCRLRLWAEVALCLASAAAYGDEDGRGSGGDDKARGIARWRLFCRTGETLETCKSLEDEENSIGDAVLHLKPADFQGPERTLAPSDAPRLWCILGDLENEPAHYERAWEISNRHFSRAQRSLGEYYIGKGQWEKAQEAYKKATSVNRLNPEMWGRLGDISLRLQRFEDAAEAFTRSIGSANDEVGGEDAKTWSNLGSALWSLCAEIIASGKTEEPKAVEKAEDEEDDGIDVFEEKLVSRDPVKLTTQALAAFKKGASIANDNWRIWENVVTLAARSQPPAIPDMVMAMRQIIRIRKTEDAVNADVLNLLLQREVLVKGRDSGSGVYEPPRGSTERLISRMIEEDVAPVITNRSELWSVVSRLRGWHRDYHGAIDAAERAWRAAFGASGSGLLAGESTGKNWVEDVDAWHEVVKRTDELVSVLENWGPDVEEIGARWRGKARNAVRSVMGKAKQNWEDTEEYKTLETLMEGLKITRE